MFFTTGEIHIVHENDLFEAYVDENGDLKQFEIFTDEDLTYEEKTKLINERIKENNSEKIFFKFVIRDINGNYIPFDQINETFGPFADKTEMWEVIQEKVNNDPINFGKIFYTRGNVSQNNYEYVVDFESHYIFVKIWNEAT